MCLLPGLHVRLLRPTAALRRRLRPRGLVLQRRLHGRQDRQRLHRRAAQAEKHDPRQLRGVHLGSRAARRHG